MELTNNKNIIINDIRTKVTIIQHGLIKKSESSLIERISLYAVNDTYELNLQNTTYYVDKSNVSYIKKRATYEIMLSKINYPIRSKKYIDIIVSVSSNIFEKNKMGEKFIKTT